MKESLIQKHIAHQKEYSSKYGNKTLVFYAVGKFYEYYEHDDMSRLDKISEILEYRKMAGKDNDPPGIGIPLANYDLKRQKLVSAGYTLIRFDEQKEGDVINRTLTSIDTIGSVEFVTSDTNYIIMVYIDISKKMKRIEDSIQFIGIAGLNISNSDSFVAEFHSSISNPLQSVQELYRVLLSYPYREITICVSGNDDDKYKKWIYNALELTDDSKRINYKDNIDPNFFKHSYQDLILHRVFGSKSLAPSEMVSYLELDRYNYAAIAYVMLLQFCYEYNENLVKSISPPRILPVKRLLLIDNAIAQLDILPQDNSKLSLYDVVNNTQTRMGERYLREMLSSPMTDIDEIERYYITIEKLIQRTDLDEIIKSLRHIIDLNAYQRKLILIKLQPHNLAQLIESYHSIFTLNKKLEYLSMGKWLQLSEDKLRERIENYCKVVNFDVLHNSEITNGTLRVPDSIYKTGYIAELDELQRQITEYRNNMQKACDMLTKISSTGRSKDITYEILLDARDSTPKKSKKGKKKTEEDVDWFYIEVTEARAKKIKENINPEITNYLGDISIIKTNTKCHIISPKLIEWSEALYDSYLELNELCGKYYTKIIDEITHLDNSCTNAIRYITLIDYLVGAAKTAIENHYHRPVLNDSLYPFADICELRHPIIERIIDAEYITNDIKIDKNGLLLYGINSGGKSSFAKAVACNIIMAQAGLYTACKLKYKPYHQIITRLSGHDNLHKGHSSYIVEMLELRTILRWADSESLVIGDELCRGTENVSGGAIIIAAINHLIERNVAFIFSTHLHYLTDSTYIKNIPDEKLRIRHLSTHHDAQTDTLIYNRKLKEGNGDTLYGLEVARGLHFDDKFLALANKIRQESLGNSKLINTKTSNYSSKVYMDKCILCDGNRNLETHHRHEQHKAENGYVNHIPLHSTQNLAVLCDKCHDRIHRDKLKLSELQTLLGKIYQLTPDS